MNTVAAFETSSTTSSVALLHGGRTRERAHTGARGHVEFCIPALMDLVDEAGVELSAIEAVAVGLGPGLFTGLRVGVQTAKTLSAALGVPVVGVSSLHALAAAVDATGHVLACMQAHRGEVFAAVFERGNGTHRVTADAAMSPEDAALLAATHNAGILGNGPPCYPTAFVDLPSRVVAPSAAAVIAVARERLERNETDDPATLEPRYLRRSEAEIRWGDTGVVAKRPDRVRFRTPDRTTAVGEPR